MISTNSACILCGGDQYKYLFDVEGHPLFSCQTCRLQFLNPQPSDEQLNQIYSVNYSVPLDESLIDQLKTQTAKLYLERIERLRSHRAGDKLLDIGCGKGNLLMVAKTRGYEVRGVEFAATSALESNKRLGENLVLCGEIDDISSGSAKYDVIVAGEVIEHVRNPVSFLKQIPDLLAASGLFFCALPSLSGWSARLMGRLWMEYKEEHLFYFTEENFVKLLQNVGFNDIKVENNKRVLSAAYIIAHFERYKTPIATELLVGIKQFISQELITRPFTIETGGITVLARL